MPCLFLETFRIVSAIMRSSLSCPGEKAPSQGDERHRLVLALRGKLDKAPGTRAWERFCAEGPVQVFYFFKPQCSHRKRGKCKVVADNKWSNKQGARGTFPEPQEGLRQWSLLLFHSLDSVTREWVVSQLDVKHLWNRHGYRLLPYSLGLPREDPISLVVFPTHSSIHSLPPPLLP